jgi:hypothetical protein
LIGQTTTKAVLFAAGKSAAEIGVSQSVIQIAYGVARTMTTAKLVTVAVAAVVVLLSAGPIAGSLGITPKSAVGETILRHDFDNGSTAQWSRYGGPSTIDASTGDLFLEPGAPGGAAIAILPGITLDDVSIRAQIRIVETSDPNDNIALIARGNSNSGDGYLAGIGVDGDVHLGRPVFHQQSAFATVPTDLRPATEDVLLQFDAFGNHLRLWAWRPGEPKPATPQIDLTHDLLTSGTPGVVYTSEIDNPGPTAVPGNAVVRFYHVANTSIPEPTTASLTTLGAALLFFGIWYTRR